jgi:uncharacterized protein YqhQ
VGSHDVLAVLARGDSSAALPRLGGMARPDGVVVVSPRFWAFAHVDGTVHEGTMPAAASTRTRRVPLVRGLAKLGASLTPLLRGRGVAGGRERLVLLLALSAPFLAYLAPEPARLPIALAATLGLLVWLFRGRTLHLHGAEHRAIAAAEQRSLVAAWEGSARPSRFALRCGTNFAALALPVALAAERLWPLPFGAVATPLVVSVLSLALSMELWQVVQGSQRRALRAVLVPGLALQRLTTREPSLSETRTALAAAASVIRRELDA